MGSVAFALILKVTIFWSYNQNSFIATQNMGSTSYVSKPWSELVGYSSFSLFELAQIDLFENLISKENFRSLVHINSFRSLMTVAMTNIDQTFLGRLYGR
ncbi:hypothetical protein ERO13_A09G105650v2 [Gossypium hirsutum]|nr:hypothetical protein ERO13_A09G105650v2 [Gossypium hirsutum]